jgi:hypothetical protein
MLDSIPALARVPIHILFLDRITSFICFTYYSQRDLVGVDQVGRYPSLSHGL